MNVKVLVFVICVEAIIYFSLYNLHDLKYNSTRYYVKEISILKYKIVRKGNIITELLDTIKSITKKNELKHCATHSKIFILP